ncbi:hypothetical protein JCM12178A_25090 [Salidesulfovibrio brasiliensis]
MDALLKDVPKEEIDSQQMCNEYIFSDHKDELMALKWCQLAADRGNDQAKINLGVMYMQGDGVEKDYKKALELFKEASCNDDGISTNNVGVVFYQRGKFLDALHWYRKAEKYGNSLASYNIGIMYLRGHGVPKSYFLAHKYFLKAARKGVGLAQINLALMYIHGLGLEIDYITAYSWLNLASANGDEYSEMLRKIISTKMNKKDIEEAQRLAQELWSDIN